MTGPEAKVAPAIDGQITPIGTITELKENFTDPDAVADFAEDIIGQILTLVDDEVTRLGANQQHGLITIADAVDRYCIPENGVPIPAMAYHSMLHELYYNLSGLIDHDWLEQNPHPDHNYPQENN